MGYASYTIYRRGEEIEAGYAIEDVCNQNGCEAKIDRGLAYLCGATPGGDEYGCGGSFCGEHLLLSFVDDEPQRCERCYARAETRRREEFRDDLAVALPAAAIAVGTGEGPDMTVEMKDHGTPCDRLAAAIRTVDGVKSADAVVDAPEVFVEFKNGWQLVVAAA